jgi:hypothetical protein
MTQRSLGCQGFVVDTALRPLDFARSVLLPADFLLHNGAAFDGVSVA